MADERRAWAVPDVLISPEEMADGALRLATDEQLAGRARNDASPDPIAL
jgi:hypothetical protein